jgi:hypothetical protein
MRGPTEQSARDYRRSVASRPAVPPCPARCSTIHRSRGRGRGRGSCSGLAAGSDEARGAPPPSCRPRHISERPTRDRRRRTVRPRARRPLPAGRSPPGSRAVRCAARPCTSPVAFFVNQPVRHASSAAFIWRYTSADQVPHVLRSFTPRRRRSAAGSAEAVSHWRSARNHEPTAVSSDASSPALLIPSNRRSGGESTHSCSLPVFWAPPAYVAAYPPPALCPEITRWLATRVPAVGRRAAAMCGSARPSTSLTYVIGSPIANFASCGSLPIIPAVVP